jgi:hypothetical protein
LNFAGSGLNHRDLDPNDASCIFEAAAFPPRFRSAEPPSFLPWNFGTGRARACMQLPGSVERPPSISQIPDFLQESASANPDHTV